MIFGPVYGSSSCMNIGQFQSNAIDNDSIVPDHWIFAKLYSESTLDRRFVHTN
jgi:hypothetical protein